MPSTYDRIVHYRADTWHAEYGFVLTDIVWAEAFAVAKAMGAEHVAKWYQTTPLREQVTTFWRLVSGEVH